MALVLALKPVSHQRLRRRRGRLTLSVYNWGEYISDGSTTGSLDTIEAFET